MTPKLQNSEASQRDSLLAQSIICGWSGISSAAMLAENAAPAATRIYGRAMLDGEDWKNVCLQGIIDRFCGERA